jgi:glycosyltransferase involved in cell wall biosynthesis
MKIIFVNTYETSGGAAKATNRIFKEMLDRGVDCYMLVAVRSTDSCKIMTYPKFLNVFFLKIKIKINSFFCRMHFRRTGAMFSIGKIPFSNISYEINKMNPDLVHLNWICDGFFDVKSLASIHAPIVWSLHDMWPFTGGCHYDDHCGRYLGECGHCKVLGSKSLIDISSISHHYKFKHVSSIFNLTVIGLSDWMKDCASSSSIFKGREIVKLPNAINTKTFLPKNNRNIVRKKFNLPTNKRLILYGAAGGVSDPRKGFNKLAQALELLPANEQIELVVFGGNKTVNLSNLQYRVHDLRVITNENDLCDLYNAVDTMVVPSLQENLSNAILESLSCGTPVVAFNIGGNLDMIDHKKNGYLANAFESQDLADGIMWIINSDNYMSLRESARYKVEYNFSAEVVIPRYLSLYKKIIASKAGL